MRIRLLCVLFFSTQVLIGQTRVFTQMCQADSVTSLRGISAVSGEICWVSGAQGKVYRTINKGETWENLSPEKWDTLQFRDIHAFGKDTALVISAGLPAVICKTVDGGKTWKTVYENHKKGIFFDGFDFWDSNRGIAFSDAIGERLIIITTTDAGDTWQESSPENSPLVAHGQGGFAASGTCIKTFGESSVAIALGGFNATLQISHDGGHTWERTFVPIDFGADSKGVFSVDFYNNKLGIVAGGDYRADSLSGQNLAISHDGGKTWKEIDHPETEHRYFSCVKFVDKKMIMAVSRFGGVISYNSGKTWSAVDGSFYSLSLATDGTLWASGPKGAVARIIYK